jgi:hypothetical protein
MSAFENITNKIAEQNAKIEELRKAHMKSLQADFNEIIKLFFDECPKVQAVVWSQYTPYFNDGDECIFSVNEPCFVTKNFDREDLQNPYEYEDSDEYGTLKVPSYVEDWDAEIARDKAELAKPNASDWVKGYYPKCIAALEEMKVEFPGYDVKIKAFAKLLDENDDMLREVYGDHVAVYLTPGEVIVEDYSHD